MNNLKYILTFFICFYLSYALSQSVDEPGKMNFYVVDTITINDPIVFYKENQSGLFIGDKNEIESFNLRKMKNLISKKNIFIYSSEFYKHLPIEEFDNYNYPDYGSCKFEKEYFKDIKGIVYRKFKSNPTKFILALINASFYDRKNTTYGLKPTVFRGFEKEIFYKIVFPICE